MRHRGRLRDCRRICFGVETGAVQACGVAEAASPRIVADEGIHKFLQESAPLASLEKRLMATAADHEEILIG